MKVIDPGHEYLLNSLDGECVNHLVFVKREGDKYPGNVGSHPGTTMQEVLRALIDYLYYVNAQQPHHQTRQCIRLLSETIWCLECRAAGIHGRIAPTMYEAINGVGCVKCGHVGCGGECHADQ